MKLRIAKKIMKRFSDHPDFERYSCKTRKKARQRYSRHRKRVIRKVFNRISKINLVDWAVFMGNMGQSLSEIPYLKGEI